MTFEKGRLFYFYEVTYVFLTEDRNPFIALCVLFVILKALLHKVRTVKCGTAVIKPTTTSSSGHRCNAISYIILRRSVSLYYVHIFLGS